MFEQNLKAYLNGLKSNVQSYIESRILLLKLEATDKLGDMLIFFLNALIGFFLLFFLILFLGIMAGFGFGQLFGNLFAGFSLVAGLYLFTFILFVRYGRKWLRKIIKNKIAGSLLQDIINTPHE